MFIYFILKIFVNTGKLSRDLQHGTSFEFFTVGFSALSAIFDCCPPEPRFHDFARVFVTNAGKVYSSAKTLQVSSFDSRLFVPKPGVGGHFGGNVRNYAVCVEPRFRTSS